MRELKFETVDFKEVEFITDTKLKIQDITYNYKFSENGCKLIITADNAILKESSKYDEAFLKRNFTLSSVLFLKADYAKKELTLHSYIQYLSPVLIKNVDFSKIPTIIKEGLMEQEI